MSKELDTKVDAKVKVDKKKVGFFSKVSRFFRDMRGEFKKIVWPTKKQVANNTAVAITFMAIAAAFILAIDFIFIKLFEIMF